jgi:hypothetical protein
MPEEQVSQKLRLRKCTTVKALAMTRDRLGGRLSRAAFSSPPSLHLFGEACGTPRKHPACFPSNFCTCW